jgi:hypothetical protein
MLAKIVNMYVMLQSFTFALLQRVSERQFVTRDTELRKALLLTLQARGDQYFVKFHYSWQMEFNISGRLIWSFLDSLKQPRYNPSFEHHFEYFIEERAYFTLILRCKKI